MKTMKQIVWLSGLLVTLVLYLSCQKEIHGLEEPKQTCKIVSAYYYTGIGDLYDSSVFTYANDKVLTAESDEKLITYTHNGANISIRTFFDKWSKSNAFVDTTEYDSNNRMKKITQWLYPGRFTVETTKIIYLFSYKDNRIEEVTSIQSHFTGGSGPDTLHHLFRVNKAGNTENIVSVDNYGNIYDSVHYAYDNTANYFARIHPNFFLFDVNFQLQGSYLHHLPYFFSTNNVREFSYYATNTYQVSYQLDSLRNVNAVTVSGTPYATYKYECGK